MTPEQQIQTILISLGSWAGIATVLLLVAKRDVKLGMKKWLYLKMKKQPLAIRYHGPDKNVVEDIIPMKGKGETVILFDKKLLFLKTGNGMTFFIDEAALRRRDDGLNELSFSYKSVMPIDPTKSPEEIRAELEEFVRRMRTEEEQRKDVKENTAQEPLEMEQLIRYTDPKRLNKFIDYVYLAAKADALAAATDMQKWVTITAIGVGIAIIGIVAVYYTLDGKIMPLLQNIAQMVASGAAAVINV